MGNHPNPILTLGEIISRQREEQLPFNRVRGAITSLNPKLNIEAIETNNGTFSWRANKRDEIASGTFGREIRVSLTRSSDGQISLHIENPSTNQRSSYALRNKDGSNISPEQGDNYLRKIAERLGIPYRSSQQPQPVQPIVASTPSKDPGGLER